MSVLLGATNVDLLLGTAPIYWVFQGTVQVWERELVVVLGNTTNVSLKTVIDNAKAGAWADVNLKKRVVVPAGVEIGGTTSAFAITTGASSQADSWAGSLILEIRGIVSGIGGTINSGAGGNAISVPFPGRNGEKINIPYYGTVRSGGGGGGRAGNGGQGVWYSGRLYQEGPAYSGNTRWEVNASYCTVVWGGAGLGNYDRSLTSLSSGGWVYYRGSYAGTDGDQWQYYQIYRQTTVYDVPNYTAGGVAGNAGRGRGFDGAATTGAAAVGGGTNAGASGKSGDGGDWGSSGQAGANGNTGNYTAGAAGSAAGLAGYYLLGTANAVLTNLGGSLLGRVA